MFNTDLTLHAGIKLLRGIWGGSSQCAILVHLGALHPCPHATITRSPGEVTRDNILVKGDILGPFKYIVACQAHPALVK